VNFNRQQAHTAALLGVGQMNSFFCVGSHEISCFTVDIVNW